MVLMLRDKVGNITGDFSQGGQLLGYVMAHAIDIYSEANDGVHAEWEMPPPHEENRTVLMHLVSRKRQGLSNSCCIPIISWSS